MGDVIVTQSTGTVTTVITTTESTVIQTIPTDPIIIASTAVGPQGPPGEAGSDGGIVVSFAWGDVSPIVWTSTESTVFTVELLIATAFDGEGAALSIGDVGNHERLMATTENDPAVVGDYQTHPGYRYDSEVSVRLYITPGAGATQGAGKLRLIVQ